MMKSYPTPPIWRRGYIPLIQLNKCLNIDHLFLYLKFISRMTSLHMQKLPKRVLQMIPGCHQIPPKK